MSSPSAMADCSPVRAYTPPMSPQTPKKRSRSATTPPSWKRMHARAKAADPNNPRFDIKIEVKPLGPRLEFVLPDVLSDRGGSRKEGGLRDFTLKICNVLESKGTTTLPELLTSITDGGDTKNVKKRVYDILNVLEGIKMISRPRDTNDIRWLGNLKKEDPLKETKDALEARVAQKKQHLGILLGRYVALLKLQPRPGNPNPKLIPAPIVQFPYPNEEDPTVFQNSNDNSPISPYEKLSQDGRAFDRLIESTQLSRVTPWDLQKLIPTELYPFYPPHLIEGPFLGQ